MRELVASKQQLPASFYPDIKHNICTVRPCSTPTEGGGLGVMLSSATSRMCLYLNIIILISLVIIIPPIRRCRLRSPVKR